MNLMNSFLLSIYYVIVLAVEETTMETGSEGNINEKQSFVGRNKERLKQGLKDFGSKEKENLINLKNKAVANLSNYNEKLKGLTGKAKEGMLKKRETTMNKIKQYNEKLKEFGGRTRENLRSFGTKISGKFGKKQPKNKSEKEKEATGSQLPHSLTLHPEWEEEESIYAEIDDPIYQNLIQEKNENKNQPIYGNVGQDQ